MCKLRTLQKASLIPQLAGLALKHHQTFQLQLRYLHSSHCRHPAAEWHHLGTAMEKCAGEDLQNDQR